MGKQRRSGCPGNEAEIRVPGNPHAFCELHGGGVGARRGETMQDGVHWQELGSRGAHKWLHEVHGKGDRRDELGLQRSAPSLAVRVSMLFLTFTASRGPRRPSTARAASRWRQGPYRLYGGSAWGPALDFTQTFIPRALSALRWLCVGPRSGFYPD